MNLFDHKRDFVIGAGISEQHEVLLAAELFVIWVLRLSGSFLRAGRKFCFDAILVNEPLHLVR